jgi:hypothetical protein
MKQLLLLFSSLGLLAQTTTRIDIIPSATNTVGEARFREPSAYGTSSIILRSPTNYNMSANRWQTINPALADNSILAGLDLSLNALMPYTSSTNPTLTDIALDFGSATYRWKRAYLQLATIGASGGDVSEIGGGQIGLYRAGVLLGLFDVLTAGSPELKLYDNTGAAPTAIFRGGTGSNAYFQLGSTSSSYTSGTPGVSNWYHSGGVRNVLISGTGGLVRVFDTDGANKASLELTGVHTGGVQRIGVTGNATFANLSFTGTGPYSASFPLSISGSSISLTTFGFAASGGCGPYEAVNAVPGYGGGGYTCISGIGAQGSCGPGTVMRAVAAPGGGVSCVDKTNANSCTCGAGEAIKSVALDSAGNLTCSCGVP